MAAVNVNTAQLAAGGGIVAVSTGPWVNKPTYDASCQVEVSGTGAVGATVSVEVSNDGNTAISTPAAIITLNGTNSIADGFLFQNAKWRFVRLNVTTISGTNATVTGTLGV